MKIFTAQTAGFCMGVHRAVTLSIDTAAQGIKNIYTVGPLIHNNQTLAILKDRGIQILNKATPPPSDSTILIRAHGIPPQEQDELKKQYSNMIDGTCPKVKTVHKVIQKYRNLGYSIVITGDEGHAEVIGLQGYAGESGHLIQTVEDVDRLPDLHKVCLVAQTTFNRETFDTIAQKIRHRFGDSAIIKKTICAATDKRQEETRMLASKVDLMIVVGGKNSANTMRLVEISQSCGTQTHFIETEKELEWEQVRKYPRIGITAGASTPAWMIRRVINQLLYLERKNTTTLWGKCLQLFQTLADLHFFVALGGVAMYYVSSELQSLPFTFTGAMLSFLYLLSIYLWNPLQSLEKNRHLDISRYRFYRAHKTMLTVLSMGSIATILLISILHSPDLFYLMLLGSLAGVIYQITIVPTPLRKFIPYSTLKDIPTSRDFFAALAWAILITFIPHRMHGIYVLRPVTVAVFLWIFYLVYLRSLIFDLRDHEEDRIMGRETLITIIGEKMVRRLITVSLIVSLVTLLTLSTNIAVPQFKFSLNHIYSFLSQIPVLLYILFFMRQQHKFTNRLPLLFNFFADGQFYIAGLCAWLLVLIFK